MNSLDWLFKWRSMETAPRDGRGVLIRGGETVARAQYMGGHWFFHGPHSHTVILERPDWQWTACNVPVGSMA